MRLHRGFPERLFFTLSVVVAVVFPTRAPAEFQVNTYTTRAQWMPAVASAADGSFVVVWASDRQAADGTSFRQDLFARRYDASGVPLTPELQVSAFTTTSHRRPAVASDPAGNFVVVWGGEGSVTPFIYGRRFDAAGEALTPEVFTVTTDAVHSDPSVAVAPSGRFVVAWQRSYGGFANVRARRFDAAGEAEGAPFVVNAATTGTNRKPDAVFDDTGQLLVTWHRGTFDPNVRGIFARRYDATGVAIGGDIPVHPQGASSLNDAPKTASMGTDRFVVTWFEGHRFWARRIEGPSAQLSDSFQANTYVTFEPSIRPVDVAGDPSGAFTIVWEGQRQDGQGTGVFGQRFDAAGTRAGAEFRVNSHTTGGQNLGAVAAQPGGGFVVTWSGADAYASTGVLAQVHRDAIFDDGFDSGDLAAWSSAATDGGDLAAAPVEGGALALRAVVDDRAPLFVQDDSPEDVGEYRARFSLDPNGFDPGESTGSQRVRVFIAFEHDPLRRAVALVLRRLAGAYALMARVRLEDNSLADTAFIPISDAPHWIELEWRRATGPEINDGAFTLWIDGAVAAQFAGLDNPSTGIDFVRLGAMAVKNGAAGTLWWDEFASRRWSALGPGPD